jgi:type IX secretion system PorP/SprF family membrane protein
MMIQRLLFFTMISLLAATESRAQDPRWSQFYANPLQMNPAQIGLFEGRFRAVANYRELYTAILADRPFRTMSASFDMRHQVLRYDYLGWGLAVEHDQVGDARFNRVKANGGLSYLKRIGGSNRYRSDEQFLIAGAQVGIGQRGFDWEQLWFSQQFDLATATVDFEAASGENTDRSRSNLYLDFNAGLMYYALFGEHSSLYAGAALHHINQPNISIIDEDEDQLHWKWVGQLGGELPLGNQGLSLLPAAAVILQNTSMSLSTGANVCYSNREWRELAIRLGAWGHLANQLDSGIALDALVFTFVLELERFQLGLSYDITTSTLTAANNARGAFEFSLIYIHPSKERVRTRCPRF